MTIRTEVLPTITAVGTAGTTATGTQASTHTLNGRLVAIKVVQGNTPHANTDITITCTDGVTTWTLLALVNNNTASAVYYPLAAASDAAGAAITFDGTRPIYVPMVLSGNVTGVVAQGGSAATCVITVIYDDC